MGFFDSALTQGIESALGQQAVSAISNLVTGSNSKKTDQKSTPSEAPKSKASISFEDELKALMQPDKENNVSEEALFAALVGERVSTLKDGKALDEYKLALADEENKLKAANGHIPYEEAAKNALKDMKASGTLSASEADTIYTEAFSGAQLDGNESALWDDTAGAGDPTRAVQNVDLAIASAKAKVAAYGEKSAPPPILRSVDEVAAGKPAAAIMPMPLEPPPIEVTSPSKERKPRIPGL